MKKIIVFVVVALVVFLGLGSYIYKTNKIIESYEKQENKENKKELLSMMLETSAGSGEYQQTTASSWPTEGYTFNETLSKCEQGSTLSWDSTKNTVVMMGNNSDRCYVYFDKAPDTVKLSDYIINLYTTQGGNNLYLHDSSLTNGAKDNSYRYAGPSDTTNNFVCFGYDSTDGTCPTDNLYRIIGVFDGEVKLIKYDYAKSTLLGTDGDYGKTYQAAGYSGTNKGQNSKEEIGGYYWNRNGTNTWSESQLNTINLNKNYLNKIDENVTKWSEKISTHTWKVGGNTYDNISKQTAPTAYQNEINSPATNKTVNAKVGLMYVSDYGYTVEPSVWGTTLYNYDSIGITNKSWMYMGLVEWTLAPRTDTSNYAFYVDYPGFVNVYNGNRHTLGVRPVLYLKSTIGYGGGSGTAAKPILVK